MVNILLKLHGITTLKKRPRFVAPTHSTPYSQLTMMITGHHQSDRHSQATQIWFAQKCGKTQLPCFHGRNAIVESFGVVGVCRRQSQVQTSPYLDIYLVPLGVSGLRPYLIAQLRWTEPRPNLFKLKARSHWMNWFVPIIFTPLSLHPIYLKYPVFFQVEFTGTPQQKHGEKPWQDLQRILSFSTALNALDHSIEDFEGVPRWAKSLGQIVINMLPTSFYYGLLTAFGLDFRCFF